MKNKVQTALPDGWQMVRLGDVLDYEQPTNYLVSSTEYDNSYQTPVLTAGKTFILGKTNETFGIYNDLPVILFDDFMTTSQFVNFPFKVKSSASKILKPKTKSVNLRVVFELMQMIKFNAKDHKRYWISEYQNLKIHLPTLQEQNKIARILSTWDKAINTLDKLIAAKVRFKKGLMQGLLTPHAPLRFAEFKDEWQEVRLGDVCEITTGSLNANAMVENGKFPFFTCAREVYAINDYAFDTEALLVSGNGANVGYIHYYNGKFNAYQRTYVLDKFTCDILFVKYFLDMHLKKRIAQEKNEGNTPYIVISTLQDMKIMLPNSRKEQNKIAQVLTTCDKELGLLRAKLNGFKKQKKALMQRLLSGEIRVNL